jgi:hypothetical protein
MNISILFKKKGNVKAFSTRSKKRAIQKASKNCRGSPSDASNVMTLSVPNEALVLVRVEYKVTMSPV